MAVNGMPCNSMELDEIQQNLMAFVEGFLKNLGKLLITVKLRGKQIVKNDYEKCRTLLNSENEI